MRLARLQANRGDVEEREHHNHHGDIRASGT